MNFFERKRDDLSHLSKIEGELYNYTLRNMHLVKNMTIRNFAQANFVSTSTVLRYVRKIGYNGWTDFQESVRESDESIRTPLIPDIVHENEYYRNYLSNIVEAIKVLTINSHKLELFEQILSRYPRIFILGRGLSREVASYVCYLLKAIGYDAELFQHEYELYSVLRRIKRDDMLLVFSYSGSNKTVVTYLEKILSVAKPTIISVTRSDNNIIQNLSDLNFYIFADEVSFHENDVTSRCAMIAIIEILLYKHVTRPKFSFDDMLIVQKSRSEKHALETSESAGKESDPEPENVVAKSADP